MARKKKNPRLPLVIREISIAKQLASNNSHVRSEGISQVKKWLKNVNKLDEQLEVNADDYKRIWTGLFYYFWMSDKPLVQEAAADRISGLIHYASTDKSAMYFIHAFHSVLSKNFDGISSHRKEKFLMLIRRFIRQTLFWLKRRDWTVQSLKGFSSEICYAMEALPFTLRTHLNEIFIEEVAKVTKGVLSTDSLIGLLSGYAKCITLLQPDMRTVNDIQSHIFSALCKQMKLYLTQDLEEIEDDLKNPGQRNVSKNTDDESNEKQKAEEEGDVSDEDEELPFDPRPGRVDVILPYITFDEMQFIKFFEEEQGKAVSRKAINIILQLIAMLRSINTLRKKRIEELKIMKELDEETMDE